MACCTYFELSVLGMGPGAKKSCTTDGLDL